MKLFITTNNIVKKEDLKKAFKSYKEFNQYIDSVINSTGLKSVREVLENNQNECEFIDITTIQIIKRMLKGNKKPKNIVITTKLYRFEVSGDNCFIIEPLVYLTHVEVSALNHNGCREVIEKELILNISDIEEFKVKF